VVGHHVTGQADAPGHGPFAQIGVGLFAAQIAGGLSGITQGLTPPAKAETPYDGDADRLPTTLQEAIDAFDGSAMFRAAFGDEFVDYLARLKRAEWDRYVATLSEWEQAEYFSLF